MEIIKFQPEQTDLVRKTFDGKEGWTFSDYGVSMILTKLPDYNVSPARFVYSSDPANLHHRSPKPLVASRLTPEEQREFHLQRKIEQQLNTHVTIPRPLWQIVKEGFDPKELEHGCNLRVEDLPMIDVFMFLPRPSEGQSVHFAGTVDMYGRKGTSLIVERGIFKPQRWVTRTDPYTGGPEGDLPIYPFSDGVEQKVFTVDGQLEVISAGTLYGNSVTAITMISDRIESPLFTQNMNSGYLPGSNGWDLTSLLNSDQTKTLSPQLMSGFGKMGESADTGKKVNVGQKQSGLKYGAIVNIFPMLLDNQITEQQLRQLTGA